MTRRAAASFRRLVLAGGACMVAALALSGPALAQFAGEPGALPTGDPDASTLTSTSSVSGVRTTADAVVSAADSVSQTAADLAQTTAEPASLEAAAPEQSTAEPVTTSVTSATEEVAHSVEATAAPVKDAADAVTDAVAAAPDGTAPLTDVVDATGVPPVVERTVDEAAGDVTTLVDGAAQQIDEIAPDLGPATSSALDIAGGVVAPAAAAVADIAASGPVATLASQAGPSADDAPRLTQSPASSPVEELVVRTSSPAPTTTSGRRDAAVKTRVTPGSVWTSGAPPTLSSFATVERPPSSAESARGATPGTPAPETPARTPGGLAPGAGTSGGGSPLVFAALVAALLLAAPGLSRWLRSAIASWPLPIPLPSLERPG